MSENEAASPQRGSTADRDAQGGSLSASDRRLRQAGAGPRRSAPQRTRGWAEDGPRSERITVHLSPKESEDVHAVCERLGMKPGAWIGEMAVRYARGQLDPIPADWRDVVREIVASRPDMAQVRALLNQIAKHANSLGEFGAETERLLTMVEGMLTRVDALEAEASERVGLDR